VTDAIKIRLRSLSKRYSINDRTVNALDGVNLDVRAGEFLCIVGPSGCGKTTLLRILAGLEPRTGGEMCLCSAARGRDVGQPLMSMVFQERSLFPWMNVRDNVAFGLKARGVSRKERYAIAERFIHKVGLSGFEDALPHQLSGGMKQRTSIARAFANDPEILLMDEPLAAVDEQTRLVLQSELLRIWEETHKTVLYVTHSLDEAIILANRILVMSARPGRVKDVIDVDAVLSRPRDVVSVKSSAAYGVLFERIWNLLRVDVERTATQAARSEEFACAC
jgi:NitT/TauT family transport system ATP-binding protein